MPRTENSNGRTHRRAAQARRGRPVAAPRTGTRFYEGIEGIRDACRRRPPSIGRITTGARRSPRPRRP